MDHATDLNELYSKHQRLLMRAAASTSLQRCKQDLELADACARRITDYQQERGATAASGWARVANDSAQDIPPTKECRT